MERNAEEPAVTAVGIMAVSFFVDAPLLRVGCDHRCFG
jgi:hypothetical protein